MGVVGSMRYHGQTVRSLHDAVVERPTGEPDDVTTVDYQAPPDVRWSLHTYPYPDPDLADPAPATPADATPTRRRRRPREG